MVQTVKREFERETFLSKSELILFSTKMLEHLYKYHIDMSYQYGDISRELLLDNLTYQVYRAHNVTNIMVNDFAIDSLTKRIYRIINISHEKGRLQKEWPLVYDLITGATHIHLRTLTKIDPIQFSSDVSDNLKIAILSKIENANYIIVNGKYIPVCEIYVIDDDHAEYILKCNFSWNNHIHS
jgi:hypothetical protein